MLLNKVFFKELSGVATDAFVGLVEPFWTVLNRFDVRWACPRAVFAFLLE